MPPEPVRVPPRTRSVASTAPPSGPSVPVRSSGPKRRRRFLDDVPSAPPDVASAPDVDTSLGSAPDVSHPDVGVAALARFTEEGPVLVRRRARGADATFASGVPAETEARGARRQGGMRRRSPRRPACVLALLVVGLAPGLASPGVARAADERTVEGPTCRVVGHDVSEEGVVACRDALEAAAPLFATMVPWRLPADARLVVHVYGDLEAYAAAMRAAGAPELADNWAATLYATHESHVVFQPRGGAAIRALTGGLPDYTRWQVVHEAVHQVLGRSGVPTYDLWPGWLEEGLCEEVAARAVAARQPPGRVAIPDADRQHLVKDALARGRFVGLDRLLYARVQAFDPERLAYAHMASFVRFLAADADRFRTLLAKATVMPAPPPGVRAARQAVFERQFARLLADVYGPLDALEARWRAAAERTSPAWFEPTRSAQWLPDGRLLVASFPGGSAQTVVAAAPPPGGYVLSGSFRILDVGDGRQADLLVAYVQRDDARFVKLALGAKGYVTMLAYAAGHWQERYRVSVDVPPDTFAPGTDVRFALTVAGGRLRLDVGGRTRFDAEAPPGFDLAAGGYGVGAWDGAVVFGDVKATPAR